MEIDRVGKELKIHQREVDRLEYEGEENDINRVAQISRRTERLNTGKDNINQQQSDKTEIKEQEQKEPNVEENHSKKVIFLFILEDKMQKLA